MSVAALLLLAVVQAVPADTTGPEDAESVFLNKLFDSPITVQQIADKCNSGLKDPKKVDECVEHFRKQYNV